MGLKHSWVFHVPYISGSQIKILQDYGIEIISIEAINNSNEIELYLSGTFEQFENAKNEIKVACLLK